MAVDPSKKHVIPRSSAMAYAAGVIMSRGADGSVIVCDGPDLEIMEALEDGLLAEVFLTVDGAIVSKLATDGAGGICEQEMSADLAKEGSPSLAYGARLETE